MGFSRMFRFSIPRLFWRLDCLREHDIRYYQRDLRIMVVLLGFGRHPPGYLDCQSVLTNCVKYRDRISIICVACLESRDIFSVSFDFFPKLERQKVFPGFGKI